jgi:acyl-CoA reductase-like NAD-dependent aldehyde dehydrogenase
VREELRRHKTALGRLISLEVGKILSEAEGEVQEAIDMADFAVGLSRQLYGLSMHSERPRHRMYEQWHPLGPVGIITAFNFPIAVWAWNAMIAAVCGDTMIWKPSRKAPLTAIAVQHICNRVMAQHKVEGVFCLAIGADDTVGEALIHDDRIPLISATGSSRMGRHVGQAVAGRLGRSLLELGGNNAIIVMDDADLHLALRAVAFGAAGTAGQRCTTTRRLFLHRKIAAEFTARLVHAYQSIKTGDPLESETLMGPLIDGAAADAMQAALETAAAQGGELLTGGKRLNRQGYFVEPAIVKARPEMPIVQDETFAPILYVMEFENLDEVIGWHNGVRHVLEEPFFVLATQNPIEMEGTYPLPEAQLDRFMFNVIIDYLPEDDEVKVVAQTTARQSEPIEPLFTGADVVGFQDLVRKVPVAEALVRYAVRLAALSRPRQKDSPDFVNEWVGWGAGLRAAQYLVLGAKARALFAGRSHVKIEDIEALAHPTLRHRILVNYRAEAEGIAVKDIIDRVLENVRATSPVKQAA